MSDPLSYGNSYWCVKSPLSESGAIFIHADEVRILPDGTLTLLKVSEGSEMLNLAIARGSWTACYAADSADGSPIAADHWDGELTESEGQ
jgi:hypothetical protein